MDMYILYVCPGGKERKHEHSRVGVGGGRISLHENEVSVRVVSPWLYCVRVMEKRRKEGRGRGRGNRNGRQAG